MAFGIDSSNQAIGDVLISTSLIPYDLRKVGPPETKSSGPLPKRSEVPVVGDSVAPPSVETSGAEPCIDPVETASAAAVNTPFGRSPYFVDYTDAERHPANKGLIELFRQHQTRTVRHHDIAFGSLLSGGARISSRAFIRELIDGIPRTEEPIIGGEMEGVGLLSASPREDPLWIVVKGISDFADEGRQAILRSSRPIACGNAARYVLSALADFQAPKT